MVWVPVEEESSTHGEENKHILQWHDPLIHSIIWVKHLSKSKWTRLRMTYRKQGTLIETSTCGKKKKNKNYKTMRNKPIVSTQHAYFLAPPLSDLANDFILKAQTFLPWENNPCH